MITIIVNDEKKIIYMHPRIVRKVLTQ